MAAVLQGKDAGNRWRGPRRRGGRSRWLGSIALAWVKVVGLFRWRVRGAKMLVSFWGAVGGREMERGGVLRRIPRLALQELVACRPWDSFGISSSSRQAIGPA